MRRALALAALGAVAWLALSRGALARAGVDMTKAEIVALATRLALDAGEAPADVLAIIEIESAFDPTAYRAEPQLGDASRGLMQLLLSTAQDRGFSGSPDALFDPETNIALGISHIQWIKGYLARRRGRPPSVTEWAAAYNAGVGNVLKGYTPLAYVGRFMRARERWQGAAA